MENLCENNLQLWLLRSLLWLCHVYESHRQKENGKKNIPLKITEFIPTSENKWMTKLNGKVNGLVLLVLFAVILVRLLFLFLRFLGVRRFVQVLHFCIRTRWWIHTMHLQQNQVYFSRKEWLGKQLLESYVWSQFRQIFHSSFVHRYQKRRMHAFYWIEEKAPFRTMREQTVIMRRINKIQNILN